MTIPNEGGVTVADDSEDKRKIVVIGTVGGLAFRPDPASGFPFAQEVEVMGTRQIARYESGEDWRGTQRRHQAGRKYRR
jgi:hypothetical protein